MDEVRSLGRPERATVRIKKLIKPERCQQLADVLADELKAGAGIREDLLAAIVVVLRSCANELKKVSP
jgi:hypothetical protein